LHLALILYPHRNNQCIATTRRYWVVRIIDKAVRGLLSWPCELQSTVAIEAIGLSLAAQVVWGIASARQRPFLLVAPNILPHDEKLCGGFLQDPCVDALEVIVEPAQLRLVQFDTGIGAKVNISGIA